MRLRLPLRYDRPPSGRPSRRLVVVLAAALLGPVLPSLAAAHGLPVVAPAVQAVALALGTTVAPLADSDRLVGVTWASGTAQVRVRWLTAAGWTEWEVPEDDSAVPEPAERAQSRPGTEPVWRPTGASLVEVSVAGQPQDLRLVRVGDGVARRTWSFGVATASADQSGLLPGVRSRAAWGADESLRRGSPSYAAAVRGVVVHHTRPAATTTARPTCRAGSGPTTPTTCRSVAGPTSATTSSSTSSAASGRAGPAASDARRSARTPRVSTPARSGSACSGT